LRQVDLSPGSFLAELPNSLAKLEAHVRWHPLSIDLVEALYLAHALSASHDRRRVPADWDAQRVVCRNRCPEVAPG
jgi:hypothetical protein